MAAWWRGYWLAAGGRTSVAVVRIAIAFAILWTLRRLGSDGYVGAPWTTPDALYRPVGVWRLFPGQPAPALIEVLRALAWASTLSMLIGLCARASHAVSLLTTLALAAFDVAFAPTWSHHNSLPLLAHLAFLGARGGDAGSVDAWLRRRRGLAPRDVPGGYQWSLRLVVIAIAAPFFAAACFKLYSGGGSLDWALSDNLRHQILARFDRIGVPRTRVAEWLLAEPARWQAAALLNLAAQMIPIAAVGLTRRPRLRALCGLVWIIEVIGLGAVMGMWNPHWLPLAAAFVDWDRLLGHPAARPAAATAGHRAALGFVAVFLLADAAHLFALNQRTRAYPLSAFPMFGEIRARRPYDRHQSYEMIGGRIEVVSAWPLHPDDQAWIDRRLPFRFLWKHRDRAELRRDLAGVLAEAQARFPGADIQAVRLILSVYVAPAYPAPARLDRVDLARIAELDVHGRFRSAIGALASDRRTIAVGPVGLDLAGAHLIAFRDDAPAPSDLPAIRTSAGFVLAEPLAGDPVYVVLADAGTDERWLVAGRARRGY